MIIAPLLFATLVAGMAGAGHFKNIGCMGVRAASVPRAALVILVAILVATVASFGLPLEAWRSSSAWTRSWVWAAR